MQIQAITTRQRRGNGRRRIRFTSKQRFLPWYRCQVILTGGRVSRNWLRPMACQLKWFKPFFTRSEAFQEVGQVGAWFSGQGDEGGLSESVTGNNGNDCLGFLTILDNILTVGELVKDLASLTLTQESWRGMREISWRRTSLRCFSGNTSATRIAGR
jgi:hypothetical protein